MAPSDREGGSTEELDVQPGLAGRLLGGVESGGRRHRAERAAFFVICGLAVMLFVANGFGLFGSDKDQAKTDGRQLTTPSPTSTSAPPRELRLAIAEVDPAPLDALAPGTFAAANTLRLGGRTYRLPSDWAVLSMVSARDGLVLHVVLPNAPNGPWAAGFAIYVAGDGTYREIPGAFVPFVVNPAGTLLIAAAEHGAGLQPGPQKLAAFALPSGAAVRTAALPDALRVQQFATNDWVLVTDEDDAARLWNPLTGSFTALSRGTRLLATSVTGDRLVAEGSETVIEQTADGGERWRRPAIGSVVGFSPPGDLLAALTPGARPTGVTVRAVTDGAEVQRFTLAPANRPTASQGVFATWSDDRSLIVQTGGDQGANARYARCTIGSPRCVDLGRVRAQLLFPGQLFFE